MTLLRILYVEDNEDIRQVAKLALELGGGLDVRLCSSGREAIDIAAEYCPDVILLDVMMPGLDGPATLAQLRLDPALADIPVAFLTAKVHPDELAALRALGADVISKPFKALELAEQVRAIAARPTPATEDPSP